MFFDRARIHLSAGSGGNGVVAFRREKFVPRGGPNGGSGGRGGHIYFVVDPGLNTLYAYKNQVHYQAERGTHGGGSNKTGATGTDLYLPVPPGTLIRDAETGDLLADLTETDQKVLVAQGGRGGRGNAAFKTQRNTAPRIAENGEPGESFWVELELKIIADVGIIGVPNAGKSTLLSVITAAKPKIADYPFTTLVPNLGVAEVDHRQIVFADIPGLLEGAHEGTGLGLEFLRHIERSRILVHLLNGSSPDPLGDFEAINQELQLFNPALAHRPQIVVLNKLDLPEAQASWPAIQIEMERRQIPNIAISAVTNQNVQQMLYLVQQVLDSLPTEEKASTETLVEIEPTADEKSYQLRHVEDDLWVVEGVAIERTVQMTNWDYYEATMRFQRILRAMGITDALREAGVKEGDRVQIANVELVWGYDNAFEE